MKKSGWTWGLVVVLIIVLVGIWLPSSFWKGIFNPTGNVIFEGSVTGEAVIDFNANGVYVPGDYNGDGKADIAFYDSSSGTWKIKSTDSSFSVSVSKWGNSTMTPVPGDYDGDRKSDLALFKPSTGKWYIIEIENGKLVLPHIAFDLSWGDSTMTPVPGDYDGDRKSDLALFKPSTKEWFIAPIKNSSSLGAAIEFRLKYGIAGAVNVPADYDGDNKTDIAFFTPSNSRWYIRFSSGRIPEFYSSLPLSQRGVINRTINYYNFGETNSIPVQGDYNGDGKAELATYKSSTGRITISSVSLPSSPSINMPSECASGSRCEISFINIAAGSSLELWWTYEYADNSKKIYCFNTTSNYGNNCQLSKTARGDQKVYINDSLISGDSYTYSFNASDSSRKVIRRISVKAAVWKEGYRSAWSSTLNTNIVSACVNECNRTGETKCANQAIYQICGNYDSDSCLEWSSNKSCVEDFGGNEYYCPTNNCTRATGITCRGAGADGQQKFCFLRKPSKAENAIGTCPGTLQCYKCEQNYTWNSTYSRCQAEGCRTCSENNGICKTGNIANSEINDTLLCCDNSDCHTCNPGYHAYNNTCIKNDCQGSLPSTNEANGTIFGANVSLSGAAKYWNYTDSENPGVCQWTCNISKPTHRKNITGFNGCVPGVGACTGFCVNYSIANSRTINGNCTVLGKIGNCYKCNNDYPIWNGSSCNKCSAGEVWNENACVVQGGCNGCKHDNNCLNIGYRIKISGVRKYCSGNVFANQKPANASCTNNYQCQSNYCYNGNCIDIIEKLESQRNLLQRAICWIKGLFGRGSISGCPD
jgi:hypothetical protein